MTELTKMSGKICLITGANSGIGFETAKALAKMGSHVVMACRNESKALAAQEEIIRESGNFDVDVLLVDMSSLESVRALAAIVKSKYQRLDVLINNAGIMLSKKETSVDGFEMQYAVHVLGPFLLTHLLLDKFQESAPSRVINISSMLHRFTNLELDNLQAEKKFGPVKTYSMSKLALLMITYSMAHKFAGSGVTFNAVHPGAIGSNLGSVPAFAKIFMKSPAKGAQTPVYLASSPYLGNLSGKYFINCKPAKSSKGSYDAVSSEKLWALLQQQTGLESNKLVA